MRSRPEDKPDIILASGSPRRKELLELIGLPFRVEESRYEEDMKAKEDPFSLAQFLALEKAREVAGRFPGSIVVAGDTFVVLDNKFLGKPKNEIEAKNMLSALSGRMHFVVSGLAIVYKEKEYVDLGEARVRFDVLTEEEMDSYIRTGEPLDKAGAYGIQGRGAVLISGIEGDYFSVVGLPLNKLKKGLDKIGYNFNF